MNHNTGTFGRIKNLYEWCTSFKAIFAIGISWPVFTGKVVLESWAYVVLIVLLLGLKEGKEYLRIWKDGNGSA
jgi:hypothetical protein